MSMLPRTRDRLKALAGYLIAAACLVWLFHDVELARLWRDMGGIHWGWVALAVVFDVLSYVFQGWRWQLLLHPTGRISILRSTQAVYAGLFANEILPMRVGELVRAYLVAHWMSAPFSTIIPSMVVERFFDAVWLAVCIGVTAIFVPLPHNLLGGADMLGILVLAATAGFLFIVFRKGRESDAPAGPAAPPPRRRTLLGLIAGLVTGLEGGLRKIGQSRYLYLSLLVSLLFLAGQILAFWLIMWAYGLRLSFWIGSVVLLVVHLGTAIPNAPANLGTYQFFTVLGLELFGVEKTRATGFSLVVFALLTVPLWLLGSLALSRSGMTLGAVRQRLRALAG